MDADHELAEDLKRAGIVLPQRVNGWEIHASGYFDRALDGLPSLRQSGKLFALNCLDRRWTDEDGKERDAAIIAGSFYRENLWTAYNDIVKKCSEAPRGSLGAAPE